MAWRLTLLALTALLASNASHAEEEVSYIGGSWDVRGTITDEATGDRRYVAGSVIIDQQEDRYRSTFHLAGTLDTPQGRRRAEVVGRGEGKVEGRAISGVVETNVVTARLGGTAGVVPFVPKEWGPRTTNTVKGRLNDDGSVTFELRTEAQEDGPGATHTVIYGVRPATP
jgi:hypothetical protein